jgi:hypothetical protein
MQTIFRTTNSGAGSYFMDLLFIEEVWLVTTAGIRSTSEPGLCHVHQAFNCSVGNPVFALGTGMAVDSARFAPGFRRQIGILARKNFMLV